MDLYFESAAMILTLITVGKMLEARAKGKTTDALRGLMKLSPETAVLDIDGVETEVPLEQVKPGDVCYIPAGCVHAIGSGVLLYEIQQSSDVTYRLYDWDRRDAQGRTRELHIGKALDVAGLFEPQLEPVQAFNVPFAHVLRSSSGSTHTPSPARRRSRLRRIMGLAS